MQLCAACPGRSLVSTHHTTPTRTCCTPAACRARDTRVCCVSCRPARRARQAGRPAPHTRVCGTAAALGWHTPACMKCTGQVLWLCSQPQASEHDHKHDRLGAAHSAPQPQGWQGSSTCPASTTPTRPATHTPGCVTQPGMQAAGPSTPPHTRQCTQVLRLCTKGAADAPTLVDSTTYMRQATATRHTSGTSCTNKSNAATRGLVMK
jgi:hypothetical protein